MRFTCDACNAQYMISDEKVGPNGVKVRCKKCGHIILVKRASEAAAAAPAPQAPAAPLSGDGLDAELGQAFDKVLGETPPPSGDLPAPAAAPAAGEGAPGAPVPAEPAAPAGPGNEWYAAVDDQQVGPLGAPAVKAKWESGEIGPDSLVWKPGLDDWKPLSQVPELQQFLAPVPRPAGRPRPTARPPTPALAAPAATPAAAPKEPEWKPSAASALAALASEEMATMKAPEPARPAPAAASKRPSGKGSLVDAMNLPEGGVDPTGAIPLPIKGLEKTGESKLERKSSVARTTAELRIKRSANRTILWVSAVMLLLLAGGVGGVFWYFQQRIPEPQAAAPQAPRTFAPPIPTPAPQPPAAAPPQAAAPQPAAPQAAMPQPPVPQAAAPQPAPPPSTAPAPARPAPSTQAAARKKPAPAAAPAEKPAPRRVAQEASPAPRKKGSADPFEKGAGGEDDFDKLLNEPPKRSVYVPPAPGGDLPERVSTGQIQEAVAGKMGSLRECLEKQQASQPDSHGQVVLAWDIDPEGRVSALSAVKGGNEPFAQCLVGVVKGIRFPKSRLGNKGDDKVKFPFTY